MKVFKKFIFEIFKHFWALFILNVFPFKFVFKTYDGFKKVYIWNIQTFLALFILKVFPFEFVFKSYEGF